MTQRVASRTSCRWQGFIALTLLLLSGHALATEADLDLLPLVDPYQCLICHTSDPTETESFALNDFGAAFLANGRVWNAELADLDSDHDGCLNGVELGDADGDGVLDGNVEELQSNPGNDRDCGGALVDAKSWGELKALFNRR